MSEDVLPASSFPYVANRREAWAAVALIEAHGDAAAFEAAAKAERCRDLGNLMHFCRWRQIERLIVLMAVDHAIGTVH